MQICKDFSSRLKRACKNKSKLYYSVRVSITVIIVAMIYSRVIVQLGGFGNSVVCAAATVLPTTELYFGETLNKVIINIVANILGMLLGYGLRMFSSHEIGKAKFAFLLPVIFTSIVLGILVRFVKGVKGRNDSGTIAFLQAMVMAALHLLGPDWLSKELRRTATTLGIAYALTILLSFLPPFWAGVDVHDRVQEYLNTLTDIFKGLSDEVCFGENCTYINLQDKPFLQPLQSLIDSIDEENSLSKFVSWEPRRHPQEQYKKIGDLRRRLAFTIQSLSTYLTTENLHFSTQFRETCREMCSESAKALAQLSLSMKHKTAPAATTYIHAKAALDLARHLENTAEAKDITSRLVESVKIIEMLARSIKELAGLVPFKQFEQDSNVPKLLTMLGSPQLFIPAIQDEVVTRANQFVALTKELISWFLAYKKKFKTKHSSVSNQSDTTQPISNLISMIKSEPQKEEDKSGHATTDINPSAGIV